MIIGLVAGALCYFAVLSKEKLGYDDSLDVVGVHGVGGLWARLQRASLHRSAAPVSSTAMLTSWLFSLLRQVQPSYSL
jgi:ammonia channel protein AmtB